MENWCKTAQISLKRGLKQINKKSVKIPEYNYMKTCAFLNVLFKNTDDFNLILKSWHLYIHPREIHDLEVLNWIKFFQFNQIIKHWHVDLPRLWIAPVGLLNAYKTHQSFGTWGIQQISKTTWRFIEVEFALPYFLPLCSADICILTSHPGLLLQSIKGKRFLQSSLADVFYMCTLG